MELTPTMHGAMIRVTFPPNRAMGQPEETERRFCFAEAQVTPIFVIYLLSYILSCPSSHIFSLILSIPLSYPLSHHHSQPSLTSPLSPPLSYLFVVFDDTGLEFWGIRGGQDTLRHGQVFAGES